MQTIKQGYRSVSTIVSLNWDRAIMTVILMLALYLGGYVALL
ncbi:hypothetical protein [Loktanella sp. 3ANDIMAR09]|nr:hypothetical protein [Loktanella sp. 3ANDIMAR09]